VDDRRAAPPRGVPPVEQICSDLIRFDTTNPGSAERGAAEYVATLLSDWGLEPVLLESASQRSNVVVRIPGTDSGAPALLVQGHLDTVPADDSEWSKHPHSGEVADGFVWGRGAVDMKNALAMTLSAVGGMLADGRRPPRDVVLAFVADEEAGGRLGAAYLVEEHRDLFDGCAAAIGEVGGFNIPSRDGIPTFAVSVADKGLRWYEIRVRGVAGHGSMVAQDNPIQGLAENLLRLLETTHPLEVLEPMRLLASTLEGRAVHDSEEVLAVLAATGPFSRMLCAALTNTVNVTRIGAGYKENVIPGDAWARLDCRYLPGQEEAMHQRILDSLGPSAAAEIIRHSPAAISGHDGEWFDRLADSLRSVVPECRVAPFVFSGGTDNKWFGQLGIPTYGFTPMLLPPGYDFPAMFHGVDERFPVSGLHFGVRVMDRLMSR
jgi:acetylornithine deacetylase/succinyl-diaminopimelate desuccinylase-like protein